MPENAVHGEASENTTLRNGQISMAKYFGMLNFYVNKF